MHPTTGRWNHLGDLLSQFGLPAKITPWLDLKHLQVSLPSNRSSKL